MKKAARLFLIILAVSALIAGSASPVFASGQTESLNYNTDIKSCANKGDWHNYPENSVEAVKNCDSDYVSIDVRLSSDGVPVLMEDSTADRMCVSPDGNKVVGEISSYTYSDIKSFRLRSGCGGIGSSITDYSVAALADVLKEADSKALIIDCSAEDIDKIDSVVKEQNASDRILYRPDKDSAKLAEKYDNVIVKYNGNIIFSVISAINNSKNTSCRTVQLGTKNQYGVIFYNSVTERFAKESVNAVFSTVGAYSGKRPDNITGWDDVISRGYNIIETDYPELLDEYIDDISTQKEKLGDLLKEYSEYSGGIYSKETQAQFKKAYSDAESVYTGASSLSELEDAYINLFTSFNALKPESADSSGRLDLSPGRIITIVLCLAAVIAAQIFFFKRRQSKN